MANFQFVLLLFNQKISWFLTGCNISPKKKKKKKKRKNIPVRVGFSRFSLGTFKWSIHDAKTTKRSKSTGNESRNKDGGRIAEKLGYGFPRRFLEVFFALSTPYLLRFNSKETKTQFLSYSLHKKTVMVLEPDDRCHDLRWYRSLSVQTLVSHSPQTFSHVGIHSRMARLWLVFRGNSERTDKLAFLEGKFLNYVFLVIYIPLATAIDFSGFE